jgi:drug/metabolite transporter (DMT)-like permease
VRVRPAILLRFLLISIIWGSSFLFIELALRGLSPMQIVLGRLSAGAGVLLFLVAVRRESLPRVPTVWAHLTLLAIVANILPFFLFSWGQQHVTSGLAGVFNGATPLFTLAIAVAALPEERLTRMRAVGLLIGFVGVFLVVGPWDQNPLTSSIPGQLACLGAALCYAISFVYTRRLLAGRGFRPLVMSGAQMGAGVAIVAAAAPWTANQPVSLSPVVVGSILFLGAVGTGLAYPLFYGLIEEAGATTASLVTYLIPVVAVTLGVLVLDEPVTWNLFAGAAVVIIGLAVAEGRLHRATGRLPVRPSIDAPPHVSASDTRPRADR